MSTTRCTFVRSSPEATRTLRHCLSYVVSAAAAAVGISTFACSSSFFIRSFFEHPSNICSLPSVSSSLRSMTTPQVLIVSFLLPLLQAFRSLTSSRAFSVIDWCWPRCASSCVNPRSEQHNGSNNRKTRQTFRRAARHWCTGELERDI